jgi:hypothetical protein
MCGLLGNSPHIYLLCSSHTSCFISERTIIPYFYGNEGCPVKLICVKIHFCQTTIIENKPRPTLF